MTQIMIVEDDRELNNGLTKALQDASRRVVSCFNMRQAKEQLSCCSPSLVILDINLPDGNGIDLLYEIKNNSPDIPVILLTANDTDDDIVNGLENGADDYITKPFSLAVLRARVNTQLNKSKPSSGHDIYMDSRFCFDFENMAFTADGSPVELSKTEQRLLRTLVANSPAIVPRDTLIDRIWTDGLAYVDENALSVAVNRLRGKLDAGACIRTVYGQGYRWTEAQDE